MLAQMLTHSSSACLVVRSWLMANILNASSLYSFEYGQPQLSGSDPEIYIHRVIVLLVPCRRVLFLDPPGIYAKKSARLHEWVAL